MLILQRDRARILIESVKATIDDSSENSEICSENHSLMKAKEAANFQGRESKVLLES